METQNNTIVTEFILQGFLLSCKEQVVLFVVFLLIYLFSITTNTVIICLVRTEPCLHKPMYFFLSNFSFLEIYYISVTVPKMLSNFLRERKTISSLGCMIQFYLLFFFGGTENFLLAIMSFDRYIAICYPLRYVMIMSERFCRLLAVGAWLLIFLAMMVIIIPITKLSFCGFNVIDHVFCDFSPLVKIACHGAALGQFFFHLMAGTVIVVCFTLIMASYIHIIITIISTCSASGMRNAFATCATHFIVVFIYYGTVIFMYLRPSAMTSFSADKVVSVFYSAVTPLLNPLIYSLRNKEVKEAIKKIFRRSILHRKNLTNLLLHFIDK